MYWIRNIYLENKGIDIGFQIEDDHNLQSKIQIMNVLFSKILIFIKILLS